MRVVFSSSKYYQLILYSFRLSFRRSMAGGFPANMAVKKNKFMEEWNGKREITEKSFEVNFANIPTLVMTLFVVPYGIYTWSRSEFLNGSDDPRYKDLC